MGFGIEYLQFEASGLSTVALHCIIIGRRHLIYFAFEAQRWDQATGEQYGRTQLDQEWQMQFIS
jgi:hypothetical protein